MGNKNLLTTKELMDYLNVSRDTIYRWRNQRGLPFKKIATAVRYELEAVQEWLEAQENLE